MLASLDAHLVGCTPTGQMAFDSPRASGANYGFGPAPLPRGKLFFGGGLVYSDV
jgi:hypothetical protein